MTQINITLPEVFNTELIAAYLIRDVREDVILRINKNIIKLKKSGIYDYKICEYIKNNITTNADITIELFFFEPDIPVITIIFNKRDYVIYLSVRMDDVICLTANIGKNIRETSGNIAFHKKVKSWLSYDIDRNKIAAYYAQLINPDVIIPDLWNLIVGFLFFPPILNFPFCPFFISHN